MGRPSEDLGRSTGRLPEDYGKIMRRLREGCSKTAKDRRKTALVSAVSKANRQSARSDRLAVGQRFLHGQDCWLCAAGSERDRTAGRRSELAVSQHG